MAWGRLAHTAILEPAKLAASVAVWDGRKAGKEYEAFAAANAGREIVKADDLCELNAMSQAMQDNPDAIRILAGTFREVSVFWGDACGPCKARPDAITDDGLLIDIKATSAIVPRDFERQAWNLGYGHQLGWYRHGLRANGIKIHSAYVIAVESSAPYDVLVYRVDDALLDHGEREAVAIANYYAKCCAAGRWPGIASGVLSLGAPAYAADEVVAQAPVETMSAEELF
jgi:hypothetical protein